MTFNGLEALRPGTDGLYSKKSLTESKNRAFSPTSAADDIENFLKNKLHGDDGSCGYNECVFMPLTFPGVGEQNNNTSHHPKPKLRNLRDPKRAKSQHSQTIPVRSIPGHREQLQQFQQKCNDEGRTPESMHESRYDVSHITQSLKTTHPKVAAIFRAAEKLPYNNNNENENVSSTSSIVALPSLDTGYSFGQLGEMDGLIMSGITATIQNEGHLYMLQLCLEYRDRFYKLSSRKKGNGSWDKQKQLIVRSHY